MKTLKPLAVIKKREWDDLSPRKKKAIAKMLVLLSKAKNDGWKREFGNGPETHINLKA
jgi:hypothetical protein